MAAPSNYIKSCENFQLEKVLADTSGAYTTDTAIDLSERLDSVSIDPNILEFRVEADSKIQAIFSAMNEAKITVVLTGLTEAELAVILGRTTVGLMYGFGDCTAVPYFMVKFKVLLTDGTYRYMEFWKCKFKEIKREFKTQKSTAIEIPYITLEAIATARVYQHGSDTGTGNLGFESEDTTIGATWFSLGDNLTTPDLVAPTYTTAPLDAASDVAITTNFVWTFNKAILTSTMIAANFFVYADVAKTLVAGALSIATNDTVVTFNPTENLANATLYTAVVTSNVKSKYGVAIAETHVHKFTTVA